MNPTDMKDLPFAAMRRLVVLTSVLLVTAAGCTSSPALDTAAATGQPVSAEVTENADGTLQVVRIFVTAADDGDNDDIECEDGVTPDGQPCADDHDEADESGDEGDNDEADAEDDDEADAEDDDDESDNDDIECEDGVTPDGQPCDDTQDEADESGDEDDNDEADESDNDDIECEDGVTPDGQPCDDTQDEAENETDEGDEGADEDGDGDVDEDDALYAAGGERSYIQGPPKPLEGRNVVGVLGFEVNPGPNVVPAGTVRFAGGFNGDGYLAATSATAVPDGLALGGTSQGIVRSGGVWRLQLLGRTLVIDDKSEIVTSPDPMSARSDAGDDEESSGEEDDGVDCPQEGDHEGENGGC